MEYMLRKWKILKQNNENQEKSQSLNNLPKIEFHLEKLSICPCNVIKMKYAIKYPRSKKYLLTSSIHTSKSLLK